MIEGTHTHTQKINKLLYKKIKHININTHTHRKPSGVFSFLERIDYCKRDRFDCNYSFDRSVNCTTHATNTQQATSKQGAFIIDFFYIIIVLCLMTAYECVCVCVFPFWVNFFANEMDWNQVQSRKAFSHTACNFFFAPRSFAALLQYSPNTPNVWSIALYYSMRVTHRASLRKEIAKKNWKKERKKK